MQTSPPSSTRWVRAGTGLVAALLLTACSNSEKACRDGLGPAIEKFNSVTGYAEQAEVNELMSQARAQFQQARQQRDDGDYEACRVSIEQVDVYLDKVKRLRRELAR